MNLTSKSHIALFLQRGTTAWGEAHLTVVPLAVNFTALFGLWCSADLGHTSLSSPSLGGCTELLLEPLSAALLAARGAGILPCGTPIIIPAGTGNQAESFSGPLSIVHNYLPVLAQGYISSAKE